MSFGADFATYFTLGMLILIVVLLLSMMKSLRKYIIKLLLPLTIFWLYGLTIFSVYPSIALELGISPDEMLYDVVLLGYLLIGFGVIQVLGWILAKGLSYQAEKTGEKNDELEVRKVEKRKENPKFTSKEKKKRGS